MFLKRIFIAGAISISLFCISCSKDHKAWETAHNVNTIAAYSSFLSLFPQSHFATQAQFNFETLSIDSACKAGDILFLKSFAGKYPKSALIKKAICFAESLSWVKTNEIKSRAALLAFQTDFPNGKYTDTCKKELLRTTASIFGVWQLLDSSDLGLLGISPKSMEYIVICNDAQQIEGFAGGLHMLSSKYKASADSIYIESVSYKFPLKMYDPFLTLYYSGNKIMRYIRLTGAKLEPFMKTNADKISCKF